MKKAGNLFSTNILLFSSSINPKVLLSSLLYLSVFGFSVNSFANNNVQALVDRNQLSVGEVFTLQVSVDSENSVSIGEPSLPVIPQVDLLHTWISTQSKSSVVSTGQGIDFKTVRTKIFNYQFSTQAPGEIRIDPIRIEVDGKTHLTKEIVVLVSKDPLPSKPLVQKPGFPAPAPQPRWPKDPIDDLEERFNQLLNRQFGGVPNPGGFMTEPRNTKEAFFILAQVDKTEAYKGEQVLASWYLYTTGRVRDIDTLKYPDLKGFWKEDIQISTQLDFEQDVINGVAYNRALLASYALFPIEAGKANIDPYKAKATIMGGYGFGQGFQATKSSENIPILIKPLPTEGKPSDFTGAVGEFQMIVDAPNKSIVTHQPFPLKIRFEGRGNAKLIELPKLPIGPDLEVYDIKNESMFFKNGQSFKEFEVQLIPRETGELIIGEMTTSYFDPKKGEYVTQISKPIRLTVLPGVQQESIGEDRIESDVLKKALPMPVTEWNPDFTVRADKSYLWFFAFAFAILALLTKLIIDLGLFVKKLSLDEIIQNRFKGIEKHLSKKAFRKLAIEVTNTVYLIMGELSGEGGSNEELDKVLAKSPPSVRREIEQPLRKLMDYFGVLAFGPKSYVEQFKDEEQLKLKLKEVQALLIKACQLSSESGTIAYSKK